MADRSPPLPNTALITGASQRIGKAIALDLAQAGVNIALHYHSADDEAAKIIDDAKAFGVKATAIKADLTENNAAGTVFAKAVKTLGPVDLLVNNASIFEADSATAPDANLLRRHFALHVEVACFLSAAFTKQNLTEGMIVNMIDQRVWRLNPNFYSYTLSKSALWAATQIQAQSFAPNIRVNAIGPGPTLANARQSQVDFESQIDGLLLKRGPELDEFAQTILYLWQAKSVTGQMIALDGGQHLAFQTPDIDGVVE